MEEKPFFTARNLAPPLGLALANILLAAAAYGSHPLERGRVPGRLLR